MKTKIKFTAGLLLLLLISGFTWQMVKATQEGGGNRRLYFPIVAKAVSCQNMGISYDSLTINGEPLGGDASRNEEYNLGYRGYVPTAAPLRLVRLGPVHDVNAPQFNTLFDDLRRPTFSNAYQRVRWQNGVPVDTESPWDVTVLGLRTTPGERIRVPDSGYNVGEGHDALVLYAEETRLTLKYTREDDVIYGYTVYIEDICVNPELLALYRALNGNGRTILPAVTGNQPLGRAIGNQIKVAIRDTGHFLDPRSCNDWWQAFPNACN